MRHDKSIVVVGGCNYDIYATSDKPLIPSDSNPGTVTTSPGGVGRNIAENLARLQHPTTMLTALGTDAFADSILSNAQAIGLDFSRSLRLPHFSTSVYVCINQCDGDIAVAVSDMGICDKIDPEYLTDCWDVLQNASIIVADANLTEETLHYLSERYAKKLCIDCVSTPKSIKLKKCLHGLLCLKANRSEAAELTGCCVTNATDASVAAQRLHQMGVQWVIISLGEEGAYVSDGTESRCMPLMNGETRNTSGCGDAFFAGAVAALVNGCTVSQLLRNGLAMARICASANTAVSPTLTPERLEQTLRDYQGGQ